MRTSQIKPFHAALSVFLAATGGCFDPFSYGPRASGTSVSGEVAYEGDVYPVLLTWCSACHSSSGVARDSGFVLTDDATADFETILSFVVPGDPEASLLLQKTSASVAHDGGQVLSESSVHYQTLAVWIEQGAVQP